MYALEGVRILDLTQVAIGPYATFLLASLGARVIKVESNRRPDTIRGPVQPAGEQQMKQYPGGDPGERPWNRGAYLNQRNRGKLGITLDFATPRGKSLLKRLVANCDALTENYRAAVMDRQGLGWDALREVNPSLVYLKLSSQGNSGPERDYGSLGSTLEQTAGLASVTGYTDGLPLMTNETYPDPAAGIVAVGALIAALRRVKKTGRGQFIDFSQRELTAGILGEAMMDYALNGRVQGPVGNRHPWAAPHGVYPCQPPETLGHRGEVSAPGIVRDAGSLPDVTGAADSTPPPASPAPGGAGDSWIAIAVQTDAQWSALCDEMQSPQWSQEPRFATAAGRWRNQEELDARLAEWTARFEHRELMHRLQRRGVPAGAVLTGRELLADPQLAARGWWESVTPTEIGRPYPFVTAPWRMSGSPFKPSTPAPCLGEHNDAVYLDLLGLDPAEYAELQAEGVISTDPVWVRE